MDDAFLSQTNWVACACSRPGVDDRLRDVARWVHMTSPAKATAPSVVMRVVCGQSSVSPKTAEAWRYGLPSYRASGRSTSYDTNSDENCCCHDTCTGNETTLAELCTVQRRHWQQG
jgi:hypothetical protein